MYSIKQIRNFEEAKKEMLAIDVDGGGIPIMAPKSVFKVIKITEVSRVAATVMKQEMLSIGGDVGVAKGTINATVDKTDVLIFGTVAQVREFIHKISIQPFGLKKISQDLDRLLTNYHKKPESWEVGKYSAKRYKINFDKPLIMGIVNVTPDSFFDGSKYSTTNAAVRHARELVKQGAHILDIGGESSRPGSESVSAKTELERVLPVVKALVNDKQKGNHVNVPISVDTYKPEVAEACLKSGAHIINDISGFKNPRMISVCKKFDAGVIAMHMQGTPKSMQQNPAYNDVVREVFEYLEDTVVNARNLGVTKLVVDPGIGFGKTLEHNLLLLKNLTEFKSLGCPILVGASRKSFIGKISNVDVDKRLPGTIAANSYALLNGANILRVHDVEDAKLASEVIERIKKA